jgi:hypothetical protein
MRSRELELIQTHMTKSKFCGLKWVLCPAAGARASRIKVTREKTGGNGQARLARRRSVVCVRVCDSDSLAIMKKLL